MSQDACDGSADCGERGHAKLDVTPVIKRHLVAFSIHEEVCRRDAPVEKGAGHEKRVAEALLLLLLRDGNCFFKEFLDGDFLAVARHGSGARMACVGAELAGDEAADAGGEAGGDHGALGGEEGGATDEGDEGILAAEGGGER